ncbi:MAG: GNAT family N-acetyltransferase [Pseudomonadales bacterium]|nr:GNAT family N-acetyltransferase [Pseudomonadales bacterium]
MQLQSCKADTASWLKEFYQKSGYDRPVSGNDDLYYAEENDRKIGVLRISYEHGHSVLRGMQVLEEFRGQGIGTKLLSFVEQFLGADPVYCIPRDHLIEFYGKIGFSVIDPEDAPEFLAERLNSYIENGLNVLIMRREGSA